MISTALKRASILFPAVLVLLCAWTCSHAFTLKVLPAIDLSSSTALEPTQAFNGFNTRGVEPSPGYKSIKRAVLYSLLLPGLGQHYLGEKNKARAFFLAEGAVWTSFVVFRVQSHLRKESYKDYALVFAGIKSIDHSDDFFREIGDYDSSDEYEEIIKSEGRFFLYPNYDNAALEEYYLQERISDFEPWFWRSTGDRSHYYSLRWGSRLANRRALYTLAAGFANRVVSAVLALRTARRYNLAMAQKERNFHINIESYPDHVSGRVQFGISLLRDF